MFIKKLIQAFIIPLAFLFVLGGPVTAEAQQIGINAACSDLGDTGLNGVVLCIASIFEDIIMILMAAAVVYVVYGAFLMISNEEKREDGKKIIYHGIIGLFVMISIWGLVSILDKTFGLSGSSYIKSPPQLIK
jgi:hypothetical protein